MWDFTSTSDPAFSFAEGVNVIPDVFVKSASYDEKADQVELSLNNGEKVSILLCMSYFTQTSLLMSGETNGLSTSAPFALG